MKDSHLLSLLQEQAYEELENYWLELLETRRFELDDLLQAARILGRQKQKDRAHMLITLVEEYFRENHKSVERLQVLKEILRYTQSPKRVADLRDEIRDLLSQIYSDRPSFTIIMRHFEYDSKNTSEGILEALEQIETWLAHDIGQYFYQEGYGAGQVREINLRLRVLRIDFEKKKDVTVEMGDRDIIPLPPGHLLREKLEHPEEARRAAREDPEGYLARLLQTMGRPLTAGEIKEAMAGVITPDEWSRWWNAARKNSQVIVIGKGLQAKYEWSTSAAAVERAICDQFDKASISGRMDMVRQNLHRKELLDYFADRLVQDARKCFAEKKSEKALELLELFEKWPGKKPDPGYSKEDVLRQSTPDVLLSEIKNPVPKMDALKEFKRIYVDNWIPIFLDSFLRQDQPRVLSFLMEELEAQVPEAWQQQVQRVMQAPNNYPAAFTWLCELASVEQTAVPPYLLKHLDGKFLLAVIQALENESFVPYRSRLKKALENGLLLNILSQSLDSELAGKAIDLLEQVQGVEEYRRERWRNVIRMRIPERRKADDYIFVTRESLERKRAELEHLIKVELPTNRKAVGEAAAHGDLRENHEYKAARERQEYLIHRVETLQSELSRVRILEPGQIDCKEVRPGTRVVLRQDPDKTMSVTLLGPWDSNPKEGIYSYQAPLGLALIGKSPGETIQWNEEKWVIEKIEPWA